MDIEHMFEHMLIIMMGGGTVIHRASKFDMRSPWAVPTVMTRQNGDGKKIWTLPMAMIAVHVFRFHVGPAFFTR